MRKGTWLRPMVLRVPLMSHFLPEHKLDDFLLGTEETRCGKLVVNLPVGAYRQDWRVPWTSNWTCQDCVAGLRADEEADVVPA